MYPLSWQHNRDMNDRLNHAANTILQLEQKVRELSQPDNTLGEMLGRVRDAAETELRRYQVSFQT